MKPSVAVLLLGFGLAPCASRADPVIVGVLEDPQCKSEPVLAVRALFAKRPGQWTALDTQEASQGISFAGLQWTVAADGKSLGVIKTTDPGFESPYPWTYPRDRLLDIVPGQLAPIVKNDHGLFAGWCDVPTREPLVVVSSENYRDPQGWKPFKLTAALSAELFPHFKAAAGPASICPHGDGESSVAWAYTANDLIVSNGYRDSTGKRLVSLGLDRGRNTCDGPPGSAWGTRWFLIGEQVLYLGRDLSFVGAGDYDGDGESEVLFWYSGYNLDGYTFFYDGLRQHVDYHWNYH